MTAVVSVLLAGLVDGGFVCDSRRFAQTVRSVQAKPDYVVVKDVYSNYDYGFSVRIPKGLIALQSPAPFPNHGFAIQLADQPSAVLSVDASYNAGEWSSFEDAIKAHVDIFKRELGYDVNIVDRVQTVLGGLRAIRFTIKPTISGPTDFKVREVLLAFRRVRGEVGIVYEIVLTTLNSRYNKDKYLVGDLKRTWRLKRWR